MKFINEYGPIYNWEHSKGESVYEFLVFYIMVLDYDGFQFYQTILIHKVLESTGMEHWNGFPTPMKFDAPLGTEVNGFEAKKDWPNSYDYVLGMMLYLSSDTRTDISLAVHQCYQLTHNTKASHEMDVKRIC